MNFPRSIIWFRQDLRLADNPALMRAAEYGEVIPLYLWSPEEEGEWAMGGASKVWLHRSLSSLRESLKALGADLVIREGDCLVELARLAAETGAKAVFWNRRYEPHILRRDEAIAEKLRLEGFEVETLNSSLLFEPWEIQTQQRTPYQVYTPFWRACMNYGMPAIPLKTPSSLRMPAESIPGLALEDLPLLPSIKWDEGIHESWSIGENGAREELKRFIRLALADYDEGRNRMDRVATSRLSPYLHFGEISPRQVWHNTQHAIEQRRQRDGAGIGEQFLKELVWREFAYHLLHHFPHTTAQPLRENFARFPWKSDARLLRLWQKGLTGYPTVDAGMRELWRTGWMHNRARMVVASFLVKDLLIPWQEGASWFWDTLVDADLASNTMGWQWTSGCGADAAPFFRIFNPISQGAKFDPDGEYVRCWIPELAALPTQWIHQPFKAPADVLAKAGVKLGKTYPFPIVDHDHARGIALEAYEQVRVG